MRLSRKGTVSINPFYRFGDENRCPTNFGNLQTSKSSSRGRLTRRTGGSRRETSLNGTRSAYLHSWTVSRRDAHHNCTGQNGTISIIDRVKNLVKLAGGEYIAVERLESVYKGSNLVGNLMVHATADANRPMAVSDFAAVS